jgi:DNA gyrase subunit A
MERAHILEGRKIVVENLDEIIKIIRASETATEAQSSLISNFSLSEIQAKDILSLPLRSLTRFDRQKIIKEYQDIVQAIKEYQSILESEDRIIGIISEEIKEIIDKYGDARRTEILQDDSEGFQDWTGKTEEDFVTKEEMVITLTQQGYIKSIPAETYSAQHRGGVGVKSMEIGKDDFLKEMIIASTHDTILFLTIKGKVFKVRGYQIKKSKQRVTKGINIVNLIRMDQNDKIQAMIPVSNFNDKYYLVLATRKGLIKKTSLSDYANIRSTGIIAIQLREQDKIVGVKVTDGNKEIMLATLNGKAIKFNEKEVRSVGRSSIGVLGMRLRPNDFVVDMAIVDESKTLLTVCEMGYGKRTKFNQYRRTRRNGKGVINIKTERNGNVIAVKSVAETDYLLIVASDGKLIQIPIKSIRTIGRSTSGVTLMRLEKTKGVKISSVAILSEEKYV